MLNHKWIWLFLLMALLLSSCRTGSRIVPQGPEKQVPTRDFLLAQIIDLSGAGEEVASFKADILRSFIEESSVHNPLTRKEKHRVTSMLHKTMTAEDYRKKLYTTMDKQLSAKELERIARWYKSPAGNKIITLEKLGRTETERQKQREYSLDLKSLLISPERLEILLKLNDLTERSAIYTEIAKARRKAVNMLASNINELSGNDKNKAAVHQTDSRKIKKQVVTEMIYIYREASGKELNEYLNFLQSLPGKKIMGALKSARQSAVSQALSKLSGKKSEVSRKPSEATFFSDLNFRFSPPGENWVELDPKRLSPDAVFALYSKSPKTYFMVIAEPYGMENPLTNLQMAEISMAGLKSRGGGVSFGEMKNCPVDGITGTRYHAERPFGIGTLYYDVWTGLLGGYAYQLITIGDGRDREAVSSRAEDAMKSFSIINRERRYYSRGFEPFREFMAPSSAFSIKQTKTPWTRWKNIRKEFPTAITGGVIQDSGFIIQSFASKEMEIPQEAMKKALLDPLNIPWNDAGLKLLKKSSLPGGKESIYKYTSHENSAARTWFLKFLEQVGITSLFAVFSGNDDNALKSSAKELFLAVCPAPPELLSVKDSGLDKEARAAFLNSVGLYHHSRKEFARSIPFFRKATILDPETGPYLTNLLRMYSYEKQYKKGLLTINMAQNNSQENSILSWKAWFLYKTGNIKDSISVYEKLFLEKGHRRGEDFSTYISMLSQEKKYKKAEKAFASYANGGITPDLVITMSKFYSQQERHEKAYDLLAKYQASHEFDTDVAFQAMRTTKAMGRHKETIDLAEELIALDMDTADAYHWKGDAQYQLKRYVEAKKSLEKALSLSPGDQDITEYIRLISALLGEGNNSSVKTEINPVPIPDFMVERLKKAEEESCYKGYSAYYISRVTGIDYRRGKGTRTTVYEKIKLLDSGAVSRFSTLKINFNPVTESLYVNSLKVFDAQGREISRGNPSDYYIIDKQESSIITHDQTLNLPISNLKSGHTISLAYTRETSDGDGLFDYQEICLSGDRPIGCSALFLTGDTDGVQERNYNMAPGKTRDKVRYWIVNNPFARISEPEQVNESDFLPMVRLADGQGTWKDLGDEYISRLSGHLKPDREIRRLAEEITRGSKSTIDTIDRIVSYVQTTLSYKPIEFGSRGQIPNLPSKILGNRYGDCKDHTLLTHLLLKSAGIRSRLALVRTDDSVSRDLPALKPFDHMILFILDENVGFVDPTYKGQNLVKLTPPGLAGRNALVISKEGTGFRKIPGYMKSSSKLDVKRRVKLLNHRLATIDETLTLSGYSAGFMRDFLISTDPIHRRKWFSETLASRLKGAEISELEVEGLKQNKKPVIIKLTYNIARPTERMGGKFFLKIPGIWEAYYMQADKVSQRKTDFRIQFPLEIEGETRASFSEGCLPVSAHIPPIISKGDFGEFSSHFSQDNREIKLRFKAQIRPGEYNKERYKSYTNFSEDAEESASLTAELIMDKS